MRARTKFLMLIAAFTLSCDTFLSMNPEYCDESRGCAESDMVCDLARHRCVLSESVPVMLSSVAPPGVGLTTGETVISLMGQGFSPGLKVILNNDLANPITATYVSASELQFTLPANLGSCNQLPVNVQTAAGVLAPGQGTVRYKYGNLSYARFGTPMMVVNANLLADGDMNADGNNDLVLGYPSNSSLAVFTGDGKLNLTATPRQGFSDANYSRLKVVDMDMDGTLDILAENSNNFDPYRGLGNLSYNAVTRVVIDHGASDVAQLDNTSGLDLAFLANSPSRVLWIPFNGGMFYNNGNVRTAATLIAPGISILATALNLGGNTDLVAATGSPSPALHPYSGDGAGGFQVGSPPTVTKDPVLLAALDVNADNKKDLIIVLRDSAGAGELVLGRNVNNSFEITSIATLAMNPARLFVEDLDCDNEKDIVIYHTNDTKLYVFRNTGLGGFATTPVMVDLTITVLAMSMTNLNIKNDNKLDLAIINQPVASQNLLSVFQNTSN